LAHRWREQLVLEQTVGAIRAGRDDEALALALQGASRPSVFAELLARMIDPAASG
jgi:hypothetical protein